MKKIIVGMLLMFTATTGWSLQKTGAHHLDVDMSGAEYRRLLDQQKQKMQWDWDRDFGWIWTSNRSLKKILDLGERNLDWLNHINSRREEKLSFSSPDNRRSYPIDAPYMYNEEIVQKKYADVVAALPPEMKSVLIDGQAFTDQPPIAVEQYLKLGLWVDYVYQGAARWLLMKPYLRQLSRVRRYDIRGYYFLNKLDDRAEKLKNLNALAEAERNQINAWLRGICFNDLASDSKCNKRLNLVYTKNNGDATEFFAQFFSNSAAIYNWYFQIPQPASRKDVAWTSADVNTAVIPFLDDGLSAAVKEFLHNIEIEWQWQGWKLLLNYTRGNNIPYVRFEKGVTPHVDRLGGNEIVMDDNAPLSEWDVQWTIRHEFGHVLGFPDCYVEFYDSTLKAVVNYQIDTSNLMCSRIGQMKETHFSEMKRNYFRE